MSDLPQLLNLAKTQRRITSVTHATVFNISFCSHTIPYEGSLVVFVFFKPRAISFSLHPVFLHASMGSIGGGRGAVSLY